MRSNKSRLLFIPLALVVLLLIVIASLSFLRSRGPIPSSIKKQSDFVILYPNPKTTGYELLKPTVKYDSSSKVVSFDVTDKTNKLVFSEQATPQQFSEIPQYWEKFSEKLQAYSTFDSADGTVALTHPKELNGVQSAVFKGKGTLMFITAPGSGLSDSSWRKLFNNLLAAN